MTKDLWIENRKEDAVKSLQKLLAYRSVEGEPAMGEAAIGKPVIGKAAMGEPEGCKPFGPIVYDCLMDALSIGESLGFKTKNLDGYCGYLEAGEGDETIGILAHLDVVPEGDGWKYPPYGGEIHDGKLFGRGTIDDKGPAVAAMYALAAVKNSGYEFKRRVRIILGCNEETNMKCVEHYLKVEGAPTMTLTPDGSFPLSCSEKSIMQIKYRKDFKSSVSMKVGFAPNIVPGFAEATADGVKYVCEGIQAHAAMPWNGKNAIQMMFIKLASLGVGGEDGKVLKALSEGLKMDYYGETLGIDREDASGRQTVNLGMVSWDENGFEMTFDLRCPTSIPAEDIYGPLDKLFESIGAKKTYCNYNQGYSIDEDCELVRKLMAVYQNRTGDLDAKPIHMGGGTYARHIPNAVSFGPEGYLCESDCHVANEFISLDQFEFLMKILSDAIVALAC